MSVCPRVATPPAKQKKQIFIRSIFNSIRDTSSDIKYHRPLYSPIQTEAGSLKGNLTWNAFRHGTWAKLNLLYSSAMLLSNFTNFEEFHSSWRDIVLDVEERRNQFIYVYPSEIRCLKFVTIYFQLCYL